jgi:hypothetical protein
VKAHTAAGKLQGMKEDALWYEAANTVGITNALNVVTDALSPYPGTDLIEPVNEGTEDKRASAVFADIRDFYQSEGVPLPFRIAAHDPGYLGDLWETVRHAFTDQRLTRRFKEAIAFAVSVTTSSRFGTAFHLAEMRRLGVGDKGVMEVLGMTQMFSSYTKIADTLQLDSDMGPVPRPG